MDKRYLHTGVFIALSNFLLVSTIFYVRNSYAQEELQATNSSITTTEVISQDSNEPNALPDSQQESQGNSQEVYFVFEKEELKDEIAEVKRTLNGQLSEYRQSEQDFRILQGQYFQLNTLSSLEAAIQATRDVLEKRNEVLRTYLTLLKLELNNTSGMKLEYRDYAQKEIEALELALLRHNDQVRTSLDRVAIAQASEDFKPTGEKIRQIIDFSRSILQLARYQALYDSTSSVLNAVASSQDGDTQYIKTPQDQRAFDQITTLMKSIESSLQEADTQVLRVITPNDRGRATSVSLDKTISSSYGGFRQVYRYLDELLGNF